MKLQELYEAIQRNDPMITSIDPLGWTPTTITLGEALRAGASSTSDASDATPTYNTHIKSLSVSLEEHLISKPNTSSTIQYMYDYIRTSSLLEKVVFSCKGCGFSSHRIAKPTRHMVAISFCRSIALNPNLQQVHLCDIYQPQLPLQYTIVRLLRNNTHSLKVLELDDVAFLYEEYGDEYDVYGDHGIDEEEIDCEEWLEFARAIAEHPTLEQFKWRSSRTVASDYLYGSLMYCIKAFVRELFELLAPNNGYANSLHTLELYPTSAPEDLIQEPSISDALVNLVSSTTTLRHLGLSYHFGYSVFMKNFLSALEIAATRSLAPISRSTCSNNNDIYINPPQTRVLSKFTFDGCYFSEASYQLLIEYYQSPAHTIVPDLCFRSVDETCFGGWYLKGDTKPVSKLFGGFSSLKSLDLQFADRPGHFDDFFNAMYEQAIATVASEPVTPSSQQQRRSGVGFPLEYLRISSLEEHQMKNMIRSLPYLVKLREFHLDGRLRVSDNPRQIVDAFRANESLHVVTLSFQEERLDGSVHVPMYPHHENQIQAFSRRNKLLPQLLMLSSSPSPIVAAQSIENGNINSNMQPSTIDTVADGANSDDVQKDNGSAVGVELFPMLFSSAQQSSRTGPNMLLLGLLTLAYDGIGQPPFRHDITTAQHQVVGNGKVSKRPRYGER